MAPLEITTTITMRFRHDAQVALELGDARTRVLDRQLADVFDRSATASVVQDWALGSQRVARQGPESRPEPWSHEGTYPITLRPYPNDDVHRFSSRADGLCRAFRSAFARERSEDRPTDAARFADELAHAMETFVLLCRDKAVARSANGRYADVLEAYLHQLRAVRTEQDQHFHSETLATGIGAILADEQYLLLGEDERLRNVLVALQREASDLYQWSMHLASGGIRRSR